LAFLFIIQPQTAQIRETSRTRNFIMLPESCPWTALACAFAGGFIAGSVPFGHLVGMAKGVDIRRQGSGNIGATNVSRVLGRRWGALVFVLDFLKGFLPVMAVLHLYFGYFGEAVDVAAVLAGIGGILGHNYTPWLGFKGGKGIATSAGVLAGLIPWTFLASVVVWGVTARAFRYVSAASIAAAVSLPVATWFFYPGRTVYFVFCLLAGGLGVWRHRSNIGRLLAGTENRIGGAKAS
jgi:acyl phosphate:glycerol-3-phosphate acyltransferase